MNEGEQADILALANGVYPINENTKVVELRSSGVSIATGDGGVKALKMHDVLGPYRAQFIEELNTIYVVSAGTWVQETDSGYQRLTR